MVEQSVNILIIVKDFLRVFLCIMHIKQRSVTDLVKNNKIGFVMPGCYFLGVLIGLVKRFACFSNVTKKIHL